MSLTTPYAGITKIIKETPTEEISNPYQVGDILYKSRMGGNKIISAYQVLKTTPKGVQLQEIDVADNKPIKDKFTANSKLQRKQISKNERTGDIGIYLDRWPLHTYKQ